VNQDQPQTLPTDAGDVQCDPDSAALTYWNTVEHCIDSYYDAFSDSQLAAVIEGLISLRDEGTFHFRVGSGFSKTEIICKLLLCHSSVLLRRFHIRLIVGHCFSCDYDPDVHAFLMAEFPDIKLIFASMVQLKDTRAYDVVSKTTQIVPYVDLFSGGFVCKTRSSYNNTTQSIKAGCVKNKAGATSETFCFMEDYLATAKPSVVVLENLKELTSKSSGDAASAQSDLDYIVERLNKIGYVCTSNVISPAQYEAVNHKTRLYIVDIRSDNVRSYDTICTLTHVS
jgi:hypothetical protein